MYQALVDSLPRCLGCDDPGTVHGRVDNLPADTIIRGNHWPCVYACDEHRPSLYWGIDLPYASLIR
jgi:hypothetical protein